MDTIDWQGSRNSVRAAMSESVQNALGIVTFTRNVLYTNRTNPDPGFGILFAETDAKYATLLDELGIKQGTASTKTANTENVDIIFKDMATKLNHFDDLIRPVFPKGSLEWKSIWGLNRNRFYRGSFENRETALDGLARTMHAFPLLVDASAEVLTYHDFLQTGRSKQQGLIGGFKTVSIKALEAIEALILQMGRNLGWLNFYYALNTDSQALVNAFFDLAKIINHDHHKTYTCHTPIGGFVKTCRHGFKITDTVKITVDGTEDVLFCLMPDGTNACDASAFRATAGSIVIKPALDVFPDLTNKQVIGTNTSLTVASHFIFEIIEA
jgi:hypothetical protein